MKKKKSSIEINRNKKKLFDFKIPIPFFLQFLGEMKTFAVVDEAKWRKKKLEE